MDSCGDRLGNSNIMKTYDTEINDATSALVAWFKHQNVTTEDALVIMCRLIASILVEHSNTQTTLRQKSSTIGDVIKKYSLRMWAMDA
jgi:hypothetical protein